MKINDRIKEVRLFFDMTQEKFGEKIGVARNTVANYEIGNRTPMDQTLKSICREFCVSEEWLKDGKGEMFPPIDKNEELMGLFASALRSENMKKKLIAFFLHRSEEEAEAIGKFIFSIYNELYPED